VGDFLPREINHRSFSVQSEGHLSSCFSNVLSIGLATRIWQLGLEMRPLFNKESLWAYPLFGGVGASFGYWLQGVESKQLSILGARRTALLEKRARRAEREAAAVKEES
jgi:hypothetical protein